MTKTYDRIERSFIENILKDTCFLNNITNTFIKCVNIVYFSIFINENKSNWFKPTTNI